MEAESSRFDIIARRARAGLAVLAVGALGVGFTACGDDEEDEATDSVNSALEEAGVDTEEFQDSVDEAQDSVESALDDVDTEELEQQAEEAQKQLEELQDRTASSPVGRTRGSCSGSSRISRSSPPAWRISIRRVARASAEPPAGRATRRSDRVAVDVVLEQGRVLGPDVLEPVEVEVRHRHPARVALADRERRRGDPLGDPERPAGPADQGRLPGPDLAAHQDDVAGRELGARAARRAPRSPPPRRSAQPRHGSRGRCAAARRPRRPG